MDDSRLNQVVITTTFLLFVLLSAGIQAGPREQAYRLHERIAGVAPDATTLNDMTTDIVAGELERAAGRAITHPDFYRTTLKNFAAPWTNRDQNVFAPLSDYVATVIGMVRDDADFREILYGDYLYVGAGQGLPAYSVSDNSHYETLEATGADLAAVLERRTQSSLNGLPAEAAAGVMTSRAAARAFFIAGTNRAMFRFTLLNHLCLDLEQVADTSRPPDRIRQDVTRSPGGDSRLFRNNCVGCHSGMDPLAQAFAYYNFSYDADADPTGENGRLVYNDSAAVDPETGSRVVAKYHFNSNNFPFGYVTPDDRWDNYWRVGQNSLLGWDAALPGTGSGAQSMGRELASSDAFASCQVNKVFRAMCLREPENEADRTQTQTLLATFRASGHSLKPVFAGAATYCMGE